jgi:hypothetical protein
MWFWDCFSQNLEWSWHVGWNFVENWFLHHWMNKSDWDLNPRQQGWKVPMLIWNINLFSHIHLASGVWLAFYHLLLLSGLQCCLILGQGLCVFFSIVKQICEWSKKVYSIHSPFILQAVYSRVGRLCKKDNGGRMVLRDVLTSFFKTRLNCSISGEFPFYFDEIRK